MFAKTGGIWNFRSYDEKTWFRFLVILLLSVIIAYGSAHYFLRNQKLCYEYTKLNQDQTQFINRIYMDSASAIKAPDDGKNTSTTVSASATAAASATKAGPKPVVDKKAAKPNATDSTVKSPLAKKQTPPAGPAKPTDSVTRTTVIKPCPCKQEALCRRVISYLQNTFDGKLDKTQADSIRIFLCKSSSQDAAAFLSGTRFKVESFFWLIGPSVYWEVIFWALFGVLCSLLFNLGVVGSEATTDLANPRSQFDASEIYGQVAKILYAPICTLSVVLGYNFFKDQSFTDISFGKGLIIFGFLGGFYSTRLISLMDRLKDVLMPNSGTTSLPIPSLTAPGATVAQVIVQLALLPTNTAAVLAAAAGPGLNNATVQMKAVSSTDSQIGKRKTGDPDGAFTFTNLQPGNYIITASLDVQLTGVPAPITLKGQINGPVRSGIAPIVLSI